MKVGTDGVLLGAWGRVEALIGRPCSLLDVGTGSGLVALMLAQQYTQATITAIDIDPAAAEQAQDNFMASAWSDRLQAQLAALQSLQGEEQYDLIASNPPYFKNSLKAPGQQRAVARHTDTLSYEELIRHSERLLKKGGHLMLVLPAEAEAEIMVLTSRYAALRLSRICYVQGRANKPAKRVLLHFVKSETEQCMQKENLVLECGVNSRTEEYARLTEAFYL